MILTRILNYTHSLLFTFVNHLQLHLFSATLLSARFIFLFALVTINKKGGKYLTSFHFNVANASDAYIAVHSNADNHHSLHFAAIPYYSDTNQPSDLNLPQKLH